MLLTRATVNKKVDNLGKRFMFKVKQSSLLCF